MPYTLGTCCIIRLNDARDPIKRASSPSAKPLVGDPGVACSGADRISAAGRRHDTVWKERGSRANTTDRRRRPLLL